MQHLRRIETGRRLETGEGLAVQTVAYQSLSDRLFRFVSHSAGAVLEYRYAIGISDWLAHTNVGMTCFSAEAHDAKYKKVGGLP